MTARLLVPRPLAQCHDRSSAVAMTTCSMPWLFICCHDHLSNAMTARLLQDTNSWFQSVRHFRPDHEIVPLKPRNDPPRAAAKLHKATRRLSFMQRMSRDMRRRKSIDESAENNQNMQVACCHRSLFSCVRTVHLCSGSRALTQLVVFQSVLWLLWVCFITPVHTALRLCEPTSCARTQPLAVTACL